MADIQKDIEIAIRYKAELQAIVDSTKETIKNGQATDELTRKLKAAEAEYRNTERAVAAMQVRQEAMNRVMAQTPEVRATGRAGGVNFDSVQAFQAEAARMRGLNAVGAGGGAAGPDILGGIGRQIGGYAAGFVGIQQVIGLLRASVDAAEEAKVAITDFNAALAGTGQYTPELSAELQNLAKNFQDLTTVDSKQFLAGFAEALQRGINPEQLDEVSRAAVVLSERTGQTLPQAFNTLSRVQQGNFLLLTRQGLQYKETGDRAKDFAEVLKILSSGFELNSVKLREQQGQWEKFKANIEPVAIGAGGLINKYMELMNTFDPATRAWILLGKAMETTSGASEEMLAAAAKQDTRLRELGIKAGDAAEQVKTLADRQKELADNTSAAADAQFRQNQALIDTQQAEGGLSPERAEFARKASGLASDFQANFNRRRSAENIVNDYVNNRNTTVTDAQFMAAQQEIDAARNEDITLNLRRRGLQANAFQIVANEQSADAARAYNRNVAGGKVDSETDRFLGQVVESDAQFTSQFVTTAQTVAQQVAANNAATIAAFRSLFDIVASHTKELETLRAQNRNNPTRQ